MYLGTHCELTPTKALFQTPNHPYTEALLSAILELGDQNPKHIKLKGEVPTPIKLPPGCVFHGRCHYAQEICKRQIPPLEEINPHRHVACFFPVK